MKLEVRLWKSQEGLEIANLVMQMLLMWTAQVALNKFSFPRKHLHDAYGNIICRRRIRLIWGIDSLTLHPLFVLLSKFIPFTDTVEPPLTATSLQQPPKPNWLML